MSLRLRLSLILGGLVTATLILAWVVAGRAVIRPFAEEVFDNYLGEVLFVARRIEAGEQPRKLAKELGLKIRVSEEPAHRPTRRRQWRRHRCKRTNRDGREMIICRGPRAPVSVKTKVGWIDIRRDLDVGAPGQKIGRFLLMLALVILAISTYLAFVTTKPLEAVKEAISRVTAGDLDHRLPISGPKELRQIAQAFNQMSVRVREMLEAERSLMAGISHELRTPLARLRLETELLRDQGLPEKRLNAIEADLEEADRLIGELLEVSRLQLGEKHLDLGPIDLREVVEEATRRCAISTHEIQIDGNGARTTGDFEKLIRVVSNLISNAAKYAPPESRISIELEDHRVTVSDEGPGVSAEAIPRLFEPFYRCRGSQERSGLGLGLMIAHQVVTLHGGTIEARNRIEGGLAVSFAIPQKVTEKT